MLVADLHERIRLHALAAVRSRRFTQAGLAEHIGVKQSHISNFLRSRRGLSIEVLDAILQALGLNVQQLIAAPDQTRVPRHSSVAPESVPLIHPRAAMNPAFANDEFVGKIGITMALLRRLKAETPDTRRLWARFVAVKADRSLSTPMNPRVENGSVLLVDRHYCSLAAYRKDAPNLYLIRNDGVLMFRRVQAHGTLLCLRPENSGFPLGFITINPKKPLTSCIVGRVAHIATET